MNEMEQKISRAYKGATVANVLVDEFSEMVYATVNGYQNVHVGQIGDFA